MAWIRSAITDGEIDALKESAERAWGDDTRYAHARGSAPSTGQCYVVARWLVHRLGGTVGVHRGHFAWLSPDRHYVIDLTGNHTGQVMYGENSGFEPYPVVDNARTERFTKRANLIFDNLGTLMKVALDFAGDAFPAEEPQAASDREQFDSYWHDEPAAQSPSGIYEFVFANGQLEVSPNHGHDELAEHAGVTPDAYSGPFVAGHVSVTNGMATWQAHANVNLYALQKVLKDYCKQVGWEWGGLTDIEGQPINDDFAPKRKAQVIHYVFDGEHLWLGRTSHAELALRSVGSGGYGDEPAELRTGFLRLREDRVEVHPVHVAALPSLFEWADDQGLKLYAANDNVIKTIPDYEVHNIYAEPPPSEPRPSEPRLHEREPSGLYKCPACSRLFPRWEQYQKHRRDEESWGDPVEDGGFPELPDMDKTLPENFHEFRTEPGIHSGAIVVMPVASWREASRVDGFSRYASSFNFDNDDHTHYVAYQAGCPIGFATVKDGEIVMVKSAVENRGVGRQLLWKVMVHHDSLFTHSASDKTAALLRRSGWINAGGQKWKWAKGTDPKDLIDAPLPFIYDVEKDEVMVGHPGSRTTDLQGDFTPGGIVEGNYEPGGKVIIRSMTSTPYTVRHLVELWYYQHPELEVKSVHIQDDEGKDTRLASVRYTQDVTPRQMIRTAVAANPAAYKASNALSESGGRVFVVGGAVRDAIMGRDSSDVDMMVTGLPADDVRKILAALPGKLDFTGKDFGIFRYKTAGVEVEIALPRREHSTGDVHQDFDVQVDHTMTPEEDLYRRDFTANAIAYDIARDALVDPYHGMVDIYAGRLRTLSEASFREDPLRVMRALVARSRFGFEPDEATRLQMTANASVLEHLPAERVQAELDKLFGRDPKTGAAIDAPYPAEAILLAHETGVLGHILPEVEAAFGYDQNNPHHEFELGEHLLNVLTRAAAVTDDADVRLAALLHDIGKPASAWVDPETGSNHYYAKVTEDLTLGANHEEVGAAMARERLTALKYANARIDRIGALVEYHMFAAFTTKKGARKFINRVGDHQNDLFAIRYADNGGKKEYGIQDEFSLDTQAALVEQVRNEGQATDKSMLAIDGHHLIEAGVKPGPIMAKIFDHLVEQVLDNPEMNTKDYLLTAAKEFERTHA